MGPTSAWELAELECRIKALEAENKRLKTNIQLLGDELNSLADRYDNLDDEKAKLKEVVEAARHAEIMIERTGHCYCSAYAYPIIGHYDWCHWGRIKEALKGREVEK